MELNKGRFGVLEVAKEAFGCCKYLFIFVFCMDVV